MPSVPWRVEFSKIFKIFFFKIPKTPKILLESIQTCFGRVLGQTFEKFCPVFHGRSSLRKFSKNQKICKIPKMPKIVPKSIQTCFELVLGQIFRKIFAQFSMEGRVVENFQKKSKNLQKSKNAQKCSQKYPNVFWTCFGANFRKNFAQFSMEGRVFENFPKIKNFAKFQKCPKSFPKVSKRVLNLFWVKFFEKFFCPVFRGGSSFRKISYKSKNSQNSKMPKIVPKSLQTCFQHVLGQTFRKIFAQFSMECRVFENFQKKFFKIPKMPKSVPKSIQTCFRVIFSKKNLCPVFHGGSSFRKFSKNFFFQNSKNAQNPSRKYPSVF